MECCTQTMKYIYVLADGNYIVQCQGCKLVKVIIPKSDVSRPEAEQDL